jgi:hypothetical protein
MKFIERIAAEDHTVGAKLNLSQKCFLQVSISSMMWSYEIKAIAHKNRQLTLFLNPSDERDGNSVVFRAALRCQSFGRHLREACIFLHI